MKYNCDIQALAPLPSGPLPTEQELGDLVRRQRRRQMQAVVNWLHGLLQR